MTQRGWRGFKGIGRVPFLLLGDGFRSVLWRSFLLEKTPVMKKSRGIFPNGYFSPLPAKLTRESLTRQAPGVSHYQASPHSACSKGSKFLLSVPTSLQCHWPLCRVSRSWLLYRLDVPASADFRVVVGPVTSVLWWVWGKQMILQFVQVFIVVRVGVTTLDLKLENYPFWIRTIWKGNW